MKENLLKIINHYGVMPQLKYFQSEVFELNEAIIDYEHDTGLRFDADDNWYYGHKSKEHIAEEIADVMVMLEQFRLYYDISDMAVKDIMINKIERQLERINNEKDNNN